MSEKIDGYVRQTYRYFYDDGLVELSLGLLFILVGGVLFTWQNWGNHSVIDLLVSLGLVAVVFGGVFLVNQVIRKLKQRVIYPRTGYVAYRQEEPGKKPWFLWSAILLLLVLTLFLPDAFSQLQFFVGSILAAVLFFFGYRVRLWRFYLLGLAVMLVGIAATITTADEVLGSSLTFLGAGCLLLLSGGLTLIRYLRRHPQPEDETS